MPPGPALYSIGHSNHAWKDFIALLEMHSIEALADVRSVPYSRFYPHFRREKLKSELEACGIDYIFMGAELGGRPNNGIAASKSNRWALYRQMACQPAFKDGVDSLSQQARSARTAMMCSEGDPAECHRYLLITNVLKTEGERVSHILRDGSIKGTATIKTYDQLPKLYSEDRHLFR